MTALIFAMSALVAACTEASAPAGAVDAAIAADARPTDDDAGHLAADAAADAGGALDAEALDAEVADAGASGVPTTCDADCRAITLRVAFGAARGGFERGFYGITAASASESGRAELHLEAISGGGAACPGEGAPTPDWNLIVDGIPLPFEVGPVELGSGLAVSFFDFAGSFLPGPRPLTTATAASVTVVAADVCEACVGGAAPSDPDGLVAIDVAATFAEGQINGHVYATHCDSMDLR